MLSTVSDVLSEISVSSEHIKQDEPYIHIYNYVEISGFIQSSPLLNQDQLDSEVNKYVIIF